MDKNSRILLDRLNDAELSEAFGCLDLYIGECGSAFDCISENDKARVELIGMDPSGGVLFAIENQGEFPIVFVGSEGEWCYFSDFLEQAVQIIISLPFNAWCDVTDTSFSKSDIVEIIQLTEDFWIEEIQTMDEDEKRELLSAANYIETELNLQIISDPLDILINNRSKLNSLNIRDNFNNLRSYPE